MMSRSQRCLQTYSGLDDVFARRAARDRVRTHTLLKKANTFRGSDPSRVASSQAARTALPWAEIRKAQGAYPGKAEICTGMKPFASGGRPSLSSGLGARCFLSITPPSGNQSRMNRQFA